MSSSVSSERAFSQGGITISKRRNCLKGDVVEALQCIKCAMRHDLLFRAAGPSSAVEKELVDGLADDAGGEEQRVAGEESDEDASWEALLIDEESGEDDLLLDDNGDDDEDEEMLSSGH